MIKNILSSICAVILFSNQLQASAGFEPEYGVSIVSSINTHLPPSINTDFWRAATLIKFDNGLMGYNHTEWRNESQAKQSTFGTPPPIGDVNILISDHQGVYTLKIGDKKREHYFPLFRLQSENQSDPIYTNIALDREHSFDTNPRVVSVTGDIETISGWFSNEYNYCYVIELEDGRTWITEKQNWEGSLKNLEKQISKVIDEWAIDSRIIVVGDSTCTCLINIDSIPGDKVTIEPKNYFLCTERVL